MDDRYDSPLLAILQHEGKIDKFLNIMLGFLYRRTDFYRLMKSKKDKLGFPPGVALEILTTIFQQYDELSRRDDELREVRMETARKKQANSAVNNTAAVQDTTQEKSNENKKKSTGGSVSAKRGDGDSNSATNVRKETETQSVTNDPNICESVKDEKTTASSTSNRSSTASSSSSTSNSSSSGEKEKARAEADEDPELTKQQQVFQNNPESYNGAVRDNYTWAQSITDVDLRVQVPSYIRKGRDVKVDFAKKHIKVSHKDDQGQWKVIIDGDLTWEVNKEESMWTLNPGENVHINFEKREERWWDAVLIDEPKINVRKIDASRPMTDLDDEAQAKIEEMMYNDRQKKMGLPTAQEQKMQDMMKTAWDAEGSPFKGQPFDPSKFSMDGNTGVVNMKPP